MIHITTSPPTVTTNGKPAVYASDPFATSPTAGDGWALVPAGADIWTSDEYWYGQAWLPVTYSMIGEQVIAGDLIRRRVK